MREIDQEIMAVLDNAYGRARETLEEHRDELEELSQRLLDTKELSADDVNEILGSTSGA